MSNTRGVHISDERFRQKAEAQAARPLLLGAEMYEVSAAVTLWNMIAPGPSWRINVQRPDLIGAAAGQRINALLHATRNNRAQAAQFAASKCLEIVKDATSLADAAQRIAACIEGQEDHATLPTRDEDRVENQ